MNPDKLQEALVPIHTDLPTPLIALSTAVVDAAHRLVLDASNIEVIGEDTFRFADDLNGKIRALGREVERQRKEVKGPYLEVGKQIDAAAKIVTLALRDATKAVSGELVKYQREQARIETERRQKEEAERREAERKRQEAAEAAQKAAEAGKMKEAMEKTREAAQAAQSAPAPVPAPAPTKSQSVTTRTIKKLVVLNEEEVPMIVYCNGEKHRLWTPNLGLIEKLMRKGVAIGGCVLKEQEVFVSK